MTDKFYTEYNPRTGYTEIYESEYAGSFDLLHSEHYDPYVAIAICKALNKQWEEYGDGV